jgi:hypothetical protein
MRKLPKSRNKNIVVQNLETEVLIYDTLADTAYCLNETSSNVFNHCDGTTSFDELKAEYKYTDELIYLALDELKAKNLLDSAANYETPFAGMNRREVIRKVGFTTMIALPMISSLVAPTAANAASGASAGQRIGTVCTTNSQCASGSCANTPIFSRCCISPSNTNFNGTVNTNPPITNQAACSAAAASQCCSGTATYYTGSGQCYCNS